MSTVILNIQVAAGREYDFITWFNELQLLTHKTAYEEKHTPVSDADWAIWHAGDWEQFSINRGYSSDEIATFKRYLELVELGTTDFGIHLDTICGLFYDENQLDYQALWLSGNHPAQAGQSFEEFYKNNLPLFSKTYAFT